MVSGTRCPAWSDQVKWWSESRAAASKGRCLVGHRSEFPDVLRGNISGLRRLIEVIEGRLEVWKADFRPEEQILGLRGRIEALRADLKPGELI